MFQETQVEEKYETRIKTREESGIVYLFQWFVSEQKNRTEEERFLKQAVLQEQRFLKQAATNHCFLNSRTASGS